MYFYFVIARSFLFVYLRTRGVFSTGKQKYDALMARLVLKLSALVVHWGAVGGGGRRLEGGWREAGGRLDNQLVVREVVQIKTTA
jgi:hypothetical protein